MLFIYGALAVGGIETFFMRMAKERAKLGLPTTILLLSKPESSNSELLEEVKKYADVLFPDDVFCSIPYFTRRFPLVCPIKKKVLKTVFKRIDQIHVFHGMHALLGQRLSINIGRNIPITIGFYHYIKYIWGGNKVAMHERINREFIFQHLPSQSLLFFSEGIRKLYTKHKRIDFSNANTFRMGVVEKKNPLISGVLNKSIKIVAIGRLVEFKTYNFYMLDVVKNLINKGYNVQFDIYGDGPLEHAIQNGITNLNLTSNVYLKGSLDYLKFDETVARYDLFIGSGTAVIQAASLGVASIVGVENVVEPKTYGYFNEVHQYEFNIKGHDLPLISVEKLITEFIQMNEVTRLKLKNSHLECIDNFTNDTCQKLMDGLKYIEMPPQPFKFNFLVYELSRTIDRINIKFNSKHPRRTQFEDFRKLSED
jgi:hypothetical protein